jgi:hypothetical protein
MLGSKLFLDAQRKVDTLKNAIKSTFKVYILVFML